MSKFLGLRLIGAMIRAGVGPDADRYCEHVAIEARYGQPCRVTFRYRVRDDVDGCPMFVAETKFVEWRPLLDALTETGILGDPTYARAFKIDAPVVGACTFTLEGYLDDSTVEPLASAINSTDHKRKAVAA